jgi:hypothetical protein
VPQTTPGASDGYSEYIYISDSWEKLGTTTIDLSGYWQKTDLEAMTAADITSIWNTVAGT